MDDFSPHVSATRPPLTISSVSGLVSCAPYLIGFTPRQSLVLVFLTSPPCRRVAVTLRMDLLADDADRADLDAAVAHLADSLERAEYFQVDLHQAHLLVFSGTAARLPARAFVARVMEVLELSEIACGEVVATDGNRIWQYAPVDGNDRAGGEPVDQDEALEVAFEMVAAGVGFVDSRDQLARALEVEPCRRVSEEDLAAARRDRDAASATQMGAMRWRRAAENSLIAAMRQGFDESVPPADVARWALALAESRVREPVMYRLLIMTGAKGRRDRLADARSWLCGMVTMLSGPECAPVAATLAAIAWQGGDGAFARIAAEHALATDPNNRLAALIATACVSGMPPDTWAQVLADFTLKELRDPPEEALAG